MLDNVWTSGKQRKLNVRGYEADFIANRADVPGNPADFYPQVANYHGSAIYMKIFSTRNLRVNYSTIREIASNRESRRSANYYQKVRTIRTLHYLTHPKSHSTHKQLEFLETLWITDWAKSSWEETAQADLDRVSDAEVETEVVNICEQTRAKGVEAITSVFSSTDRWKMLRRIVVNWLSQTW